MSVTGFEIVEVATEYVTADLIVWKRYRNRAPGILEKMLDANPQLATVHKYSPFIPVGVKVRVPIDPDLLANRGVQESVNLWTDTKGYSL